jgi:hypothetical protein
MLWNGKNTFLKYCVFQPLACRRCGQLFEKKAAVRMHEAACSQVVYQCGQCAIILTDMEVMTAHCAVCPVPQAPAGVLQPHQETASNSVLEQAEKEHLLYRYIPLFYISYLYSK